jgi:DNA-directed RNA polymerase II subunit RPB1
MASHHGYQEYSRYSPSDLHQQPADPRYKSRSETGGCLTPAPSEDGQVLSVTPSPNGYSPQENPTDYSPAYEPASPAYSPDSPTYAPAPNAYQPFQSRSPAYAPASPVYQPSSPDYYTPPAEPLPPSTLPPIHHTAAPSYGASSAYGSAAPYGSDAPYGPAAYEYSPRRNQRLCEEAAKPPPSERCFPGFFPSSHCKTYARPRYDTIRRRGRRKFR